MFYAHFVLAKKGPLARIWLAAHWDKKLTKAHVFETNIEKSVEGILQPKVKMALRTSGHLLLGVVRIYSRKAKYLLADCNEAFVKIKMAFRPGMVDLPEENREAAVNAITLPEVFHDFDTAMPNMEDVDLRIQTQFSMNTTRAEEITMREDYGNINLDSGGDDGFGDVPGMEVDGEESHAELTGNITVDQLRDHNLFSDGQSIDLGRDSMSMKSPAKTSQSLQLDAPLQDDGFGANIGGDFQSGGLFEGGGLFDEPTMGDGGLPSEDVTLNKSPNQSPMSDDGHMSDRDMGPPSPGGMSSMGGSRPGSPMGGSSVRDENKTETHTRSTRSSSMAAAAALSASALAEAEDDDQNAEQTTLLHNEEESFALAPVDASTLRGHMRAKRKRKLIVDEVKAIAGEEMKAQLSDTTDIVTQLDLAPPTKRLMHWKETGGVEKLFALPVRPLHAGYLFKAYQDLLTSHPAEDEYFGLLGDSEIDNLVLDYVPGEDQPDPRTPAKRGRKRKVPLEDDERQKEEPQIGSRRSTRLTKSTPAREEQPEPELQPQTPFSQQKDQLSSPAQAQDNFDSLVFDANQHQNMANLGWDAQNTEAVTEQTPGDDLGPMSMGVPSVGPPSMGAPTPYREDEDEDEEEEEDEFDVSKNPIGAEVDGSRVANNEAEEEMQEGETIEQFEDRVLNKRAASLNAILKSKLSVLPSFRFSQMTKKNVRKTVAQKFYSMLVLQKALAVNVDQPEENGDLVLTKGPRFETAVI